VKRKILALATVALLIIAASLLGGCGGAEDKQAAAPAEDYYKGKTIRIIVGYSAGGGYDTNARLFATYLPKYIPGNPNVIVENMPGGSSMKAANYLYSQADKDGLTMGTIDRGINIGLNTLVGLEGLEADVGKFIQIGNGGAASHILLVRSELGVDDLEGLKTAKEPVSIGGTGAQSLPAAIARMYDDYFDANMNVVAGYAGSNEAEMALQQGELKAFSINQTKAMPMIDAGIVKPVVQLGAKYLPDVPLAEDVAPTDTAKSLALILSQSNQVAYPFVFPPDTNEEAVKIMREAFAKVLEDPEYQAKAKEMDVIINPVSADEIQNMVSDTLNSPPDVVAALKKIYMVE